MTVVLTTFAMSLMTIMLVLKGQKSVMMFVAFWYVTNSRLGYQH